MGEKRNTCPAAESPRKIVERYLKYNSAGDSAGTEKIHAFAGLMKDM